MLDLTSLTKATARLREALDALERDPQNQLIRDAVIQRFEFTYELAHKMLKRFLEMRAPAPRAFDGVSFQHLIRTGCEEGLLRSGWDRWKDYRTARGSTSHAYDERKARDVAALAPDFLEEASFLLERMRERANDS